MGENFRSAFGRGQISSKAAAKASKPAILRQTRMNPGFGQREEPFDGKQGRADQAGADWKKPFDGGDRSVAGTKHIDTKQSMGSRSRASGAPSRGGSAGGQSQPIKRKQLDAANTQKPDWPGSGGSKVKKAKWSTNKRAGAIASNPNQYGDPPSRKYG